MFENLNQQQTKAAAQITLVLFGVFLFYTLRIFIDAFLGAVIIYILFRPMQAYLVGKLKWGKAVSSLVVIFSTIFIILLPLAIVVSYIVPKLLSIVNNSGMLLNIIHEADNRFAALTGRLLFSGENIQPLQVKITEALTGVVGTSFDILGDTVIMYFILFYLLLYSGRLEQLIEKYLPFDTKTISRFTRELESITYANALGAPLLAVIQAVVASVGFYLFGVPEPLFWGIMCGLFTFIPAVGSALIIIPAILILLLSGHAWQGIGLTLYCIVLVVGFENFFRLGLAKKMANVHPLVTLLGFIIGLQLFGIPGIIFGPLLFSWFLLMLRIYREEFVVTSQTRKSDEARME